MIPFELEKNRFMKLKVSQKMIVELTICDNESRKKTNLSFNRHHPSIAKAEWRFPCWRDSSSSAKVFSIELLKLIRMSGTNSGFALNRIYLCAVRST